MANKRSNKKRTRKQRNRKQKMRGGNFNVPISKFYPQNTFENDPSRQMTTSEIKGGSKKRKNHSRKYLKGGNGFFSNFGMVNTATSVSNQIIGANNSTPSIGQSYKV